MYEAAKKVQEEIGNVDILINNAGTVTCRPFLELSDKAIETTYNVNILSHYWVSKIAFKCGSMTCFNKIIIHRYSVQTSKAFLPEMIKQKRGHIITGEVCN